ncbi:MAG: 3-methyl-2-oxobutanoate hydroxymethyltransferase [Candidatus Heimdallarchaeota archaeon]|nr:3-methyl-2-oxobutanoate hydroxymethyltransferase [Candidatus Heimdallarchaeota archaeon]
MVKVTAPWCIQAKQDGTRITMLTAYDYLLANILDESGIDILLIGDSLGMVIQGENDTLGVTIEDIIYHTKIVAKAVKRALVIGDMPFMSFQVNADEALHNAGRIIKEGNAQAVKLEGGKEVVPQVRAIVKAGIPVMGHLGLTPQSVNEFGGFKVQSKSELGIRKLISNALALEDAGVFAIVLEAIPSEAAKRVTEHLKIPTIGIGAGPDCDGQVLVTYDMLGVTDFHLRFVKRYALLRETISDAAKQYIKEIKSGVFPSTEYAYNIEIENDLPDESTLIDETYSGEESDSFDDLF